MQLIFYLVYLLDEYTRITTPRQDVLFKKGYLSRPKKPENPIISESSLAGAEQANEDTVADAVTTNDSSADPAMDAENNMQQDYYMYPGYVDQNGLFYVNCE